MAEFATLTREEYTLPVKLAVWVMRLFPRFLSSDDTAHAAFFEAAHLEKMTQEQIHAAMHEVAHNRRVAEEETPFLELFFLSSNGEYFKDKEVLDFGCALGGTVLAWEAMYGVKKISGFDVSPYFIDGAQCYAKQIGSAADFRQRFGERTPFPDGAFDIVVAINVLEHVYNVENCLKECWRILKLNGHLIAVFPPIYHPFDHHIKVSRTPFLHWFFSGETVRKALNYILAERGPGYSHFIANPNPNYRIPNLNRITCRAAWKAIRQKNWRVVCNEFPGVPRVGRRAQTKAMRAISVFNSIFARVPVLSEVFLDRVAVVLQRR
ncbi:MAG: class I SAM-dependent methyltransferase [Burkholderiaceae bacterium]